MIDDAIKTWLEGQRSNLGFIRFIAKIQEQADHKASEALQPGDTESIKGEVKGLKWVIALPDELLTQGENNA